MAKRRAKKSKKKPIKKTVRRGKAPKKSAKKAFTKTAKKGGRKASLKTPRLTAEPQRPPLEETRTHPRVPVRIKIDYFKDPGVFIYDYSRNLGRGGIFIETERPMPPGTQLHLSFKLPDPETPVEVQGRVVWVHEHGSERPARGVPGMGIQFVNPEGQYKEALDRFFREIDYDNLTF
jgi:uncharacterized protein (TIGR02266 family)